MASLPEGAYPFAATDDFRIIANFVSRLYLPVSRWIRQDDIAKTYPVTLVPIGNRELTPLSGEPTGIKASPRWQLAEAWRISNVFHAVRAETTTTPISTFLGRQGTTALANALFPAGIRTLLIDNETAIQTEQKRTGTTNPDWVGRTTSGENKAQLAPFPNVKVAHAGPSSIGYYQLGAVGPVSLEAAFLLASQVAGIDWAKVRTRMANAPAAWWIAGFTCTDQGQLQDKAATFEGTTDSGSWRYIEVAARPLGTMATGDMRAGFNFMIDVDYDKNTDPKRNVFFFAVHTIDVHSRVNIPSTTTLQSLKYTTYTPAENQDKTPKPGTTGAPPAGPTKADNIRFYGHGHSAVMTFQAAKDYIDQKDTGRFVALGNYTQISFLHMYVLSENEDKFWPRWNNNIDAYTPEERHHELTTIASFGGSNDYNVFISKVQAQQSSKTSDFPNRVEASISVTSGFTVGQVNFSTVDLNFGNGTGWAKDTGGFEIGSLAGSFAYTTWFELKSAKNDFIVSAKDDSVTVYVFIRNKIVGMFVGASVGKQYYSTGTLIWDQGS